MTQEKVQQSVTFTLPQLREIMPAALNEDINKYLDPLNNLLPGIEINTPLRAAHFIAQLAHESGCFHNVKENLKYSAEGLREVFRKYFPSDELAGAYARKPEKIAARVYANRMGNRDEASGDGWKFRGRGLIQLTGRDNYRRCGEAIGSNLEEIPDQVADNPEVAVQVAGWFWKSNNLNHFADLDNIKNITRKINGGLNGLKERKAFLERAKRVMGLP